MPYEIIQQDRDMKTQEENMDMEDYEEKYSDDEHYEESDNE